MIEEELVTNSTEELENKESTEVVENEVVETEVVDAKKPEEEKNSKGKKKKSKTRSIIEWVITGIFAALFVVAGIGQIDGMIHAKQHYNQQIKLGFGSFIVKTDSMKQYPKNSAIITYLEKADDVYNRWSKYYEKNMAIKAELETKGLSEEDFKKEYEKLTKNNQVDVTFAGVSTYKGFIPTDTCPDLNSPAYPKEVVPITHRVRYIYRVSDIEDAETQKLFSGKKYIFIAAGTNTGGELALERQFQAFTETEILGTVKYGSMVIGWGFRAVSSPIGLLIFLLVPALYLIITSSLDILKALKTSDDDKQAEGVDKETQKLSSLDNLSEADRKRLKEEMLEEMMKGKGNKNE